MPWQEVKVGPRNRQTPVPCPSCTECGGAARVDVHTRLVTSTRAVGWVMSSLPKERPVSTAPQQVALFGRRILTEVQLERGH